MEGLNNKKLEDLCIEFCNYILSKEITEVNVCNKNKYTPIEFLLMKAELYKNGNNIYKSFIKTKYGIRNIK